MKRPKSKTCPKSKPKDVLPQWTQSYQKILSMRTIQDIKNQNPRRRVLVNLLLKVTKRRPGRRSTTRCTTQTLRKRKKTKETSVGTETTMESTNKTRIIIEKRKMIEIKTTRRPNVERQSRARPERTTSETSSMMMSTFPEGGLPIDAAEEEADLIEAGMSSLMLLHATSLHLSEAAKEDLPPETTETDNTHCPDRTMIST